MTNIIPADDSVDLRRGIDHIGVTVCFVVHDGKGKVLLQKRSQNCRDERGTWDIGGGAVEFGERIEDAVRREVQEELCTEPAKIEFLVTYDAHRTNHDGDQTHWVALGHAVQVDPEQIKIGEPHKVDEIGWFTSKNLPEPLHSHMRRTLDPAIELGIIQ
jgi:ADP-ribose pyrophosphatase YjhB (NUDIX family)